MIAGILYRDSANNITAPAGWTLFGANGVIRSADGVSITGNVRTYYRTAQSGDDSASFTWTMTLNQSHVGIICVFSGRNPVPTGITFSNTASQATIDAPDLAVATGDDVLQFAGITMTGSFTVAGGSLVEYLDVSESTGGDANLVAAGESGVAAGTYTAGVYTQDQPSAWHRMTAKTIALPVATAPGGGRNMLLMGAG
jgi:hypothetical protein